MSTRSRLSLGQLRTLLADRRGATAVMFAVTSIALMGLVGLGAEAGNWYVMKRHGQNGADAAAVAGALTLATASGASGCTTGLQTTAGTSGTTIASDNGFTSGSGGATVTVQAPPWDGSYTSHPCATEAQITAGLLAAIDKPAQFADQHPRRLPFRPRVSGVAACPIGPIALSLGAATLTTMQPADALASHRWPPAR